VDIKSIPAGSRCLVDSNIFIYHFAGLSADCTDLMVRIGAYELQGVVTTTIISEVLHRRMLAEALAKGLITAGQPLKKLKANPQIVQSLSDYATEMDKILQLPFEVIEVAKQDIKASFALRQSYGLFVNDSINLAGATRNGVTDIVSHDSDFQRAPIINLWMPTDL